MQAPWFHLPKASRLNTDGVENKNNVIVVGAGLAGCNVAYALACQGVPVLLIDSADTIAAGASGNYAGIVKPFVTRKPSITDAFYEHAFQSLLQLLDQQAQLKTAAEFNQCGVLQLLERAYPDNPQYSTCSAEQASSLAGTKINCEAIFFKQGGWLNPSGLCKALLEHELIKVSLNTELIAIKKIPTGWTLELKKSNDAVSDASATPTKTEQLKTHTLILANGHNIKQFDQTENMPITPARGQCSEVQIAKGHSLKTIVSGKRYALPSASGKAVVIGASFIRGDTTNNIELADHNENLLAMQDLLPSLEIERGSPKGFCAVRATTPDRFPILGPVPDFAFYKEAYALLKNGLPVSKFAQARYQPGLFVIGGFGSRGIVSSRYCATLLVDYLCSWDNEKQPNKQQFAQPNLASWAQLLHPGRFSIREARKGKNHPTNTGLNAV